MSIQSLFTLKGKTAFVTGGNSGIGEAIANALGLAGAKLSNFLIGLNSMPKGTYSHFDV